MVSDWPALTYEPYPWRSRYDRGIASRRLLARHEGDYHAAVVPPIAEQTPRLDADLLAESEDAANEIARFDTEMGGEIAPFEAVLLRSESAASSQIENLTASARAIAEAELGASSRRNAAEIVANTRAMEAAVTLADHLDGRTILAMHGALMEANHPSIAGLWRADQVWIGGTGIGPHEAEFVPPHANRVAAAIADLVAFMQRDDLPVLVQAAIVHAQFETIHPFPDGNGRTGRALLHAMLRNKGLTRNVTVPISAGLLTDTDAYFDALGTYRLGDPSAMIRQLARAAFAAITNGRHLVGDLREIRTSWRERVPARRDSAVWPVTEVLLRHPVINAQLVTNELGIAATNVYRHIDMLVEAGILTEFTDQKRNRAWRSNEVLLALDAFASRAGRRRVA